MGEVGRESASDLERDLIQRVARDYGILALRSGTRIYWVVAPEAKFLRRALNTTSAYKHSYRVVPRRTLPREPRITTSSGA